MKINDCFAGGGGKTLSYCFFQKAGSPVFGRFAAFAAVCAAVALPALADKTISENMVLAEDTDWRDQGTVTIAEGATLDLAGHVLQVSALAGAGGIVDSAQYQLLDCVRSTAGQVVDTGIEATSDTALELDFMFLANNTGSTIFGSHWGGYRYMLAYVPYSNSNWLVFYGNANPLQTLVRPSANTRYKIVVAPGTSPNGTVTIGDQTKTFSLANNDTVDKRLRLFGLGEGERMSNLRVYSCKMWKAGDMVRDFVPAKNAAGAVGLFDRLDGKFYESTTDVALLAGDATGETEGVGALRIEAADEAALADFTGNVADSVRMAIDGVCVLAADADWKRFRSLHIDGTVNLAAHDLTLASLRGRGRICDYEKLEYVESTAEQVVDTGVDATLDTALELDFTFLSGNSDGSVVFGSDKWGTQRYMFAYASSKFYFFGDPYELNTPTADNRYKVKVALPSEVDKNIQVFDQATGNPIYSRRNTLNNKATDMKLRLFGLGDNTRKTKIRVHSCKIWRSGDLKRDLVPALNPVTKEAGLLDLKAKEFLASSTGIALKGGSVSASAGKGGSLHVEVAENKTLLAESVALSGSLELVKEGEGTLVMALAGQTYTGGTRIEAGVVETTPRNQNNPSLYDATKQFLGAQGSVITVGSGAGDSSSVFDLMGNYNYRHYNMALNGGTLRNGGSDQATNQGSLGHLTLSADSTIETLFDTTVYHGTTDIWDLGGNTLSLETSGKTLYFNDAVNITNGVFRTKGTGCWRTSKAVQMRDATLYAESPIWLGAQLDVDDYYAACTTDSNSGTAAMNVYGRFTPATDYFYGCTLQDGATIDLNGRTGAWPLQSAFTGGANTVSFASGATVTIDAHERSAWTGKIVYWGAGNTPVGVTFKMDEESRAMGRSFVVRDDGLYVSSGFAIIIR